MSWRRLLAVGYSLLVEGLDSNGREEIDRVLDPASKPAPAQLPADVRVAATPREEIAILRAAEGAVV